jgi:hypothetical protein
MESKMYSSLNVDWIYCSIAATEIPPPVFMGMHDRTELVIVFAFGSEVTGV